MARLDLALLLTFHKLVGENFKGYLAGVYRLSVPHYSKLFLHKELYWKT